MKLIRLIATVSSVLLLSTTCFSQSDTIGNEMGRLTRLADITASGAVYTAPGVIDGPESMTEPVYLVENSERRNVCSQFNHKPGISVVKVAYVRTSKTAAWSRICKYSTYRPVSRLGKRGKFIVTPYVVESLHDFVEL